MTGNVFEWVWDSPWTYHDQPMKDVISEEKGSHRVFRGGSWVRNIENQRIQGRRDANQRFRINDLKPCVWFALFCLSNSNRLVTEWNLWPS